MLVFPLDAIGHNEDTFSDRNIYLDDLARKVRVFLCL